MNDTVLKAVGDWSAISAAAAAVMGWLPPIAALFTIVWIGLQMLTWAERRWEEKKWPFSSRR